MFNFIKNRTSNLSLIIIFLTGLFSFQLINAQTINQGYHSELVELFKEWRKFEQPPLIDGAPDYSQKAFDGRWNAFMTLRTKLESLEKENWSVQEQVDWHIVWAEMNGYIFNTKVLKPWQRDPAFISPFGHIKAMFQHMKDQRIISLLNYGNTTSL